MTDTETRTVLVMRDRLDDACHALNKLANKAARYGRAPVTVEIGAEVVREYTIRTYDGERQIKIPMVPLTISAERVAIGDFDLVARLEVVDDEFFIRSVPGQELPQLYKKFDTTCDHCKARRRRKDVFVVRNRSTGGHMRVGRTCVKDYLGIDPAQLAARFRLWADLNEADDEFGGRGFHSWSFPLYDAVLGSLAAIELWGWIPRSHPDARDGLTKATADLVGLLNAHRLNEQEKAMRDALRERMAQIHAKRRELPDSVIRWVREEMPNGSSDYAHNLRLAFKHDVATHVSMWGILCSGAAAWLRHQEKLEIKRREAKAETSQWVGKVGERLKKVPAVVEAIKGFEGSFGFTRLITFRTTDGNILKTFYSGSSGFELRETVKVTGTVKKHEEYNGRRETMLSRIVVA